MTAGPAPLEAISRDPAELLTELPDVPYWLYARSLLLSGLAQVWLGIAATSALVVDAETAVLVGRPDSQLLRKTLDASPPGRTLLVHENALAGVRAALPRWTARPFVLHTRAQPYLPGNESTPAGVVVSYPLDPAVLAGLPADVHADAANAPAAAVCVVNGVPVAVCAVSDVTETLWDVGIDTVEGSRRQGHATATFLALAAVMAAKGQQPVWAAYEDYAPSLALAARLGFVPAARMVELLPADLGQG